MAAEQQTEVESEEDSLPGLTFSPPVYKQRYKAVGQIITYNNAKKVLDIGCAELKFLVYIRDACLTVEKGYGVDIDHDLIERKKSLIEPVITDYIFKRSYPLSLSVFCGSIAQPDPSPIFTDLDVVSLIEIIEHLEPEILQHVPEAVFGFYHPKIVVVTTPNSEFNVLFENFTGFRHWDHKFEWSRAEFQQWSDSIARNYGYSVEYSGVGSGPEGTEHLGCCSQMAVFKRDEKTQNSPSLRGKTQLTLGSYKKVSEAIYPHTDNSMSLTEKITMETKYIIDMYCQDYTSDLQLPEDASGDLIAVELEHLLGFRSIKSLCNGCIKTFKSSVRDSFRLSEDEAILFFERRQPPSRSISPSSSINDDHEIIDVSYSHNFTSIDDEEDWD